MNPWKSVVASHFILILFINVSFAGVGGILERPILVGPQYPLIYMTTAYEPDSAFLLPQGELFGQVSYTTMNAWGYSANAINDETGIHFEDIDLEGYSVYFDTEIDRRFFRFQYGYSDSVELQVTYREINLKTGSLDGIVEGFHDLINIGNAGRDRTDRDQTDIVIHDNETGEDIFVVSSAADRYYRESVTLGLKYLIRKTSNEALSMTLSSNIGDAYIERDLNELNDSLNVSHRDLNDFNAAINYSSVFADWSLHIAYSISFVGNTLFPKSPNQLYFYFVGGNWQISQNWDFLLQLLTYSSPFPENSISNLDDDVFEITTAFRGFLGNQFAFEIGLVENQSQGPQNIDISFFSNLLFYF